MKIIPVYKTPLSLFRTLMSMHHWHALRTHFLAQMNWQESRKEGKSFNLSGPIPWWSYSCSDFLEQVVPTNSTVLEIGGGASTAWWASRGNPITTLETNPHWAKVQREANHKYSTFTEVQEVQDLSPSTLSPLLYGKKFDVVVNDGAGNRSDLALILANVLAADGILIWDNSDRVEYQEGIQALLAEGFRALHFFGLSPISAFASKTTIYSKQPFELRGRPSQFPEITY